MAFLAFSDGEFITLRNAPGLVRNSLGRFSAWTPLPDSIGPEAVSLATGQATRFRFRRQQAVSFALTDIPSIATVDLSTRFGGVTVSISGTTATFSAPVDGVVLVGDRLIVAGTSYLVTARSSATVWTLGSSGSATSAPFAFETRPLERAVRLVAHLLDYGTVDVGCDDTPGSVYTGLQLVPGTRPDLSLESPRTLRYRLSLSLMRIDGSSAPLLCRYD